MPPAINHHEHNTDSPMTIGNIPHWNSNGACAGAWSVVNEGSPAGLSYATSTRAMFLHRYSLGYCVTAVNYRIVSIQPSEFDLLSAIQSMLLGAAVLESERGLA